jgi:hypothetical protein
LLLALSETRDQAARDFGAGFQFQGSKAASSASRASKKRFSVSTSSGKGELAEFVTC